MKILILIILSLSHMYLSKNIVLPFKKMTKEYSLKPKTINDFIEFSIYTNIKMGTPTKNVAHFILKGNNEFSFVETDQLYELNYIQKEIENTLNIFYSPSASSTFKEVDATNLHYSDIYYFNDLNNKEVSKTLNFKMYRGKRNILAGFFDIYYSGDQVKIYPMILLKAQDLISDYYMTFVYDEYKPDDISNYFSDNYNNILGNLILGESPHEFNPAKYKKEDEVKIKGNFNLLINEIKFDTILLDFSKKNVNLALKFTSEFIKGTLDYKAKIEDYFFDDLILKNLCRMDYYQDNIYKSEKMIYSCENSDAMRNELVYFPTLYLEIKEYYLTFLFNYKELFKLHDNRFYFLIYFNNENNQNWEMGEVFLRKYTTSFNYDTKTISFYKTQVDEINKLTDIPISEREEEEEDEEEEVPKPIKSSSSNSGMIVLWVILGIVALAILIGIACACK